ncbi:MAG: PD40 domain-containing protein [Candidatus Atribacteria bacterium]|nr:PD40 domain-containing protein [Candidatus Atribacteria bacterium]
MSEFVDSLKTELESTFKEEISVYFDINPHDGLLETHDVDESLKDKLKCLIFIPIISRTYCDPKAFAWEHEFKAFVDFASNDQFGLKVKLPSSNVASRVLPIIIYDLDKHDIRLCESVLGGVLRGVEFIYKSPGVNRPLRANEDHPHDNINKTYYRDQVNKVANNIKDILTGLTIGELSVDDEKIIVERPIKKKIREIPSASLLYRLRSLTEINPKAWRIIALVFILFSVGLIWLYLNKKPASPDRAIIRFDTPLAQYLERVERRALAISPKAEYLVYCMNNELNLIRINSDAPSEPIRETRYCDQPFFSPDSKWIGFFNFRERKIMKVPIDGGNPILICGLASSMNEANWYENKIIYAVGSNIYSVSDNGGTPELIYPLKESENDPIIWNPQLLPDKKTLLFSQENGDGGWSILTWKLGSKENPGVLIERGKSGRFLNSGHIIYSFINRLYACKFNPKTNRIISDPQLIKTNPVMEETYNQISLGQSQFDISENGLLVYYEKQPAHLKKLVWVNEYGRVTPVIDEVKNYIISAISSDGENIAVSVNPDKIAFGYTREEETENCQIEIINIKTGNSTLFIRNADWPVWSADNTSIIYVTGNQVFQKPLDPSQSPEILFAVDSVEYIQTHDLSVDGRYLPFTIGTMGRGSAIGFYDMMNRKTKILDYYNSAQWVFYPAISPDGEWVTYLSNYQGNVAAYVAPFPSHGQTIKVSMPRSSNETNFPVWSPDMTALYYRTYIPDFEIWKVKVGVSFDQFSYEPPQSIFNGGHRFPRTTNTANVEIHPDGDRFLLMQLISETQEEVIEPRIKVVVNWEDELTRK